MHDRPDRRRIWDVWDAESDWPPIRLNPCDYPQPLGEVPGNARPQTSAYYLPGLKLGNFKIGNFSIDEKQVGTYLYFSL